jgi:hypothetical protein
MPRQHVLQRSTASTGGSRYGDRPAAQLAERLIPQFDGTQPAGTLGAG